MLPLGVKGVLDGALPEPLPATLYATYGNKIPWFLMLILAIAAIVLRRRDMHAVIDRR